MEEDKKVKSRLNYIDILNILACFCVVWLHCNGVVHTYSNARYWSTALIIEVIAYWAVPIFFMITGATLLNYREKYDTKTFFKKRLKRTMIPFLVWSLIVLIWKCETNRYIIQKFTVSNIISIFLNNSMEHIYYFFINIFAIYMTIPILSLFTKDRKNRKYMWYMVILAFITRSFLPLVCKMTGIKWNSNLETPLVGKYLIFVLLGYLLSTEDIKKRNRIIIYILGFLSMLLRYIGTYYLSTREGRINKMFFGYEHFTSVFLAIAVFIFIKNIKWDKVFSDKILNKYIPKITSCSLGIYLIHQIVRTYEVKIFDIDVRSIWWRTIGTVVTYIISLIIVLVIKKIPKINKILVP